MDLEDIKAIDSQNMREFITTFSDQWRNAMEMTADLSLTIDRDMISNICFVGMGGSAIGPDLICSFCYHDSKYPMEVIRHYKIPQWVDEHTLFIACSFSGNTEETLTALDTAIERGAQAIALTGGGELMVAATKKEIDYITVPGEIPPRAALGYSFVALYRICQYLEIVEETDGALKDTARFLAEQNDVLANPTDNEALNLAEEIRDTLPVIYSDATMMKGGKHAVAESVCRKCQNSFVWK